jgi:hypothetical protein
MQPLGVDACATIAKYERRSGAIRQRIVMKRQIDEEAQSTRGRVLGAWFS